MQTTQYYVKEKKTGISLKDIQLKEDYIQLLFLKHINLITKRQKPISFIEVQSNGINYQLTKGT